MIKDRYDKSALTIVEIMVVVAVFSIMIAGLSVALSTGQSTWFDTDTNIELQQNLRNTIQRITKELHESGFDKDSVLQVTIPPPAGINGTDILKFSIPIICQADTNVIDGNGDIARWGAPWAWGCTDASCMDPDNDCDTIDYKYIAYLVNNSNQLIRRVLDSGETTLREDVFAHNIMDFQINSNSPDNTMIIISVTAQKKSPMSRILSASTTTEVYLRNGG